MKVDGACYCGEITYEAEVDPEKVGVCYCTDCQTMTGGTTHVNTFVPEAKFHLKTGTPKVFMKTAASGNKRNMGFCGTCGTHLYAVNVEGPKVYGLRVPAMAQREQLPPKGRFFLRSQPSWVAKADSIPGKQAE
jgi:hypothetical protein